MAWVRSPVHPWRRSIHAGRALLTCDHCGSAISRKMSAIKHDHHFCDITCAARGTAAKARVTQRANAAAKDAQRRAADAAKRAARSA